MTTPRPGMPCASPRSWSAGRRSRCSRAGFCLTADLPARASASVQRFLSAPHTPLTDKIVWENGNAYTFRLRASTFMQVHMLVEEAAKLGKKRWAIVYPNYEYGQSAVASFKRLMQERQASVEFVAEQAPALGKIEA